MLGTTTAATFLGAVWTNAAGMNGIWQVLAVLVGILLAVYIVESIIFYFIDKNRDKDDDDDWLELQSLR